jgi:hypothetical protein
MARTCRDIAIEEMLGTVEEARINTRACDGPHNSRSPRKRSCASTIDNSRCARTSPERPRLGMFEHSLSLRRSAAATRSRARCRSARLYCRGFGRVCFLRVPFASLLARTAALCRFRVGNGPLRFSQHDARPQTESPGVDTLRKCVRLGSKRRSRGSLECLVDTPRDRLGAFRRRLLPECGQLLGLLG